MRPEIKIDGAVCVLRPESFRVNKQLGRRVSTASMIIEGEDISQSVKSTGITAPSLAIAPVAAFGGYTRPSGGSELAVDRGPVEFLGCAIIQAPAIGTVTSRVPLKGDLEDVVRPFELNLVAGLPVGAEGNPKGYKCRVLDYDIDAGNCLVDITADEDVISWIEGILKKPSLKKDSPVEVARQTRGLELRTTIKAVLDEA